MSVNWAVVKEDEGIVRPEDKDKTHAQLIASLEEHRITMRNMRSAISRISEALDVSYDDIGPNGGEAVARIREIQRMLARSTIFVACPNSPCVCARSKMAADMLRMMRNMGTWLASKAVNRLLEDCGGDEGCGKNGGE